MLFYPVFTIFVLQMFYEITGKIKSPKKCLLTNSHIQRYYGNSSMGGNETP